MLPSDFGVLFFLEPFLVPSKGIALTFLDLLVDGTKVFLCKASLFLDDFRCICNGKPKKRKNFMEERSAFRGNAGPDDRKKVAKCQADLIDFGYGLLLLGLYL